MAVQIVCVFSNAWTQIIFYSKDNLISGLIPRFIQHYLIDFALCMGVDQAWMPFKYLKNGYKMSFGIF